MAAEQEEIGEASLHFRIFGRGDVERAVHEVIGRAITGIAVGEPERDVFLQGAGLARGIGLDQIGLGQLLLVEAVRSREVDVEQAPEDDIADQGHRNCGEGRARASRNPVEGCKLDAEKQQRCCDGGDCQQHRSDRRQEIAGQRQRGRCNKRNGSQQDQPGLVRAVPGKPVMGAIERLPGQQRQQYRKRPCEDRVRSWLQRGQAAEQRDQQRDQHHCDAGQDGQQLPERCARQQRANEVLGERRDKRDPGEGEAVHGKAVDLRAGHLQPLPEPARREIFAVVPNMAQRRGFALITLERQVVPPEANLRAAGRLIGRTQERRQERAEIATARHCRKIVELIEQIAAGEGGQYAKRKGGRADAAAGDGKRRRMRPLRPRLVLLRSDEVASRSIMPAPRQHRFPLRVVDVLRRRRIEPAQPLMNAPSQLLGHFRRDSGLAGGTVDLDDLRLCPVANGHQQRVEANEVFLQNCKLVPEDVGGIERRQRAALARPVPFRGEWPDTRVHDVPDHRIGHAASGVLGEDIPRLVEQPVDARKRRRLFAVHIGEALRGNA